MTRQGIDAIRENVFAFARENGYSAQEIIVAAAEIVGGARDYAGKLMGRDVFAEDAAGAKRELEELGMEP